MRSRHVASTTLTGLRQRTGNWPGKTVTRAEGGFSFGGRRYKLVDLPGTYSLLSASTDEEIARFEVGRAPQGMALSADGKRLAVHNFMDRTVEVIDVSNVVDFGPSCGDV